MCTIAITFTDSVAKAGGVFALTPPIDSGRDPLG
jgi:hypothetical protein